MASAASAMFAGDGMVLTWLTSFAIPGAHGIIAGCFPVTVPSAVLPRSSRLRGSFLITCSIVLGSCDIFGRHAVAPWRRIRKFRNGSRITLISEYVGHRQLVGS